MENSLIKLLKDKFSEKIAWNEEKPDEVHLKDTTLLLSVAKLLKENGLDFLSDISSVDYKEYFEVIYQLYSFSEDRYLVIKAKLNHEKPEIESLASIWRTADWLEREVYDLMGIKFLNHPNLARILMWEGYEGHPLRKDFVYESGRK